MHYRCLIVLIIEFATLSNADTARAAASSADPYNAIGSLPSPAPNPPFPESGNTNEFGDAPASPAPPAAKTDADPYAGLGTEQKSDPYVGIATPDPAINPINQMSGEQLFWLADKFAYGRGVQKDVGEALHFYRMSAERGYYPADISIAQIYDVGGIPKSNGYGGDGSVLKDPKEAVKWWLRAAGKGSATAMNNLAIHYEDGEGVEKNGSEAVKWFRQQAEQGGTDDVELITATYDLVVLYENGDCVPKDDIEALAWAYIAKTVGGGAQSEMVDNLENRVGSQAALIAQQRSKELQIEMAQEKRENLHEQIDISHSNPPQPKAYGSGVFISSNGLFLTAAHVIKNSTSVQIVAAGRRMPAKIIQVDRANDVALLKCEGRFVPVAIMASSKVRVGETVFTLGFPDIQVQGISPKMTEGEISSISGFQDDPRQWQVSVPVQPGNSGGPLFDEQGDLVGLIEAKIDAVALARETGDIPQNVNYALKSAYLMPMLDPYAAELPRDGVQPEATQKIEDVVSHATPSVGLVLVY